ncbi:NUMOD4 domain-containing protein [Vibrio parahaemolyticus]|uniref:NUMOD4 domain-containing protein n=1 Tax=Vibrio parahaemolyticus TaxID=670 RepID=UPI00069645F8|nr:HNH endonuclease [Vibrio parahaemolyticus]
MTNTNTISSTIESQIAFLMDNDLDFGSNLDELLDEMVELEEAELNFLTLDSDEITEEMLAEWDAEEAEYLDQLEDRKEAAVHGLFDGYCPDQFERDIRLEELMDSFKRECVSWEEVEGFSNYIITHTGKVYNINTAREVKQSKQTSGYNVVCLSHRNKKTMKLVHRLVAEAFIPNPDNLETVDHIYPNKDNNSMFNLQWMSLLDNQKKGNKICTPTMMLNTTNTSMNATALI